MSKGLLSVFGRNRKNVICPKCLKSVQVPTDGSTEIGFKCAADLSSGCYYPFPIRYVNNYQYAEPLPIQVFGWSGHGKTVFLDTLRLMLLDMRKLWPEYTFQSISQLDMDKERELRSTLRQGKMPESTRPVHDLGKLQVYIMLLEKMMRYVPKWLIAMDYPGEMFQDFKVPVQLMPFLLGSLTTFFVISIPLLKDPKGNATGESIDQLMNIYIETMMRERFPFEKVRRQVIVVLTMADLLVGQLPAGLRRYLQTDDLWARLRSPDSQPFSPDEMQAYLEEMDNTSKEIREWLLKDSDGAPGGANLVGLLESTGVIAHYSLISAVGFQPQNEAPMPIQPKRVLDPFLWALEFDHSMRR
jgi:hypothetical protein